MSDWSERPWTFFICSADLRVGSRRLCDQTRREYNEFHVVEEEEKTKCVECYARYCEQFIIDISAHWVERCSRDSSIIENHCSTKKRFNSTSISALENPTRLMIRTSANWQRRRLSRNRKSHLRAVYDVVACIVWTVNRVFPHPPAHRWHDMWRRSSSWPRLNNSLLGLSPLVENS